MIVRDIGQYGGNLGMARGQYAPLGRARPARLRRREGPRPDSTSNEKHPAANAAPTPIPVSARVIA